MHCGGKTIQLNAGHYQAKIVTVGAGMAELTHGGRHLILPHKPQEMPPAHLGKVLLPWPNRVANGCYQHHGETYNLAVNDPISHTAIHGLLAWRDWQISHQSATEVSLTIFLPPSYGYPFALLAEVTYQLDATSGLQVSIAAQNIGDQPAPYGAGAHPYLTCNREKIDRCTLTIPAQQAFSVDRHGIPMALHSIEHGDLDFTLPRPIEATQIDHTLKTASAGTQWEVRIASSSQSMSTWLRSDQPWLQIYSGEKVERLGLAVEPMTCPPDAFNSGIDLISLAPQETHRLHFSIGSE